MRNLHPLIALAILSVDTHALAQNVIADLGGATTREKNVYAVYDLRGANIDSTFVERIILDAVRLYARDAQVREGIVPQPYPDFPSQMTIGRRLNGGPRPDCAGEVFSIEGIDLSMARYGEKTYHRICLFPYAGGYRINYYAIYVQQSGAGNSNPNVLSAMLGRTMGSLVGLSDSSASINKVLAKMETGLQGAGIPFKLVQLQPAGLPDRVVVDDDLGQPTASADGEAVRSTTLTNAPVAPRPATGSAIGQPMDRASLPPEIAQLQAMLTQQREVVRQQMAAQRGAVSPQPPLSPSEARKELTAMGLQYFSQEQFLAAIRRGDALAVDLFIAGGGIDLNAGDAGGTPMAVAEAGGRLEIASRLKARGAR